MTSRWRSDDAWTVLARRQDQVVAWRQVREWGWTYDDVRRPVDSGHWRRLEPGVFATTSAPLSPRGEVWQAVLATRGVACGRTALWLAGLNGVQRPHGTPVEIAIDWTRRLGAQPSSRIVHRHRDLAEVIRRGADVPRVRVEAAAVEVCGQVQQDADAAGVVLDVVQQRLCTVAQLRSFVEATTLVRRRDLLLEMLEEVADGVTTSLELRFRRNVEQAHGLPRARRNHDLGGGGGGGEPMIVDCWYEDFGVVVELDGQVAHPRHRAFRDQARDNRVVAMVMVPLRFGWRDVVGRPCAVAGQLAGVLRSRGWQGTPRRCGPGCSL